jgi:hypothetical protein
MTPEHLSDAANPLWQSTLFTGAVALLTLALRKNCAQTRYCLWMRYPNGTKSSIR